MMYVRIMDWKVGITKARVEDSLVALVMSSGSLIGDTRLVPLELFAPLPMPPGPLP